MGFSSARNLGRDISAGFSPPRRMPISEAVKKFMRVPKGAGNSVPWDPELTPYIIEPMNCLASREYDAVIFVGPARTGKTIGLIDGWIVYTIVCDPSDMLVVQMTEDKAREHSKKRLDRTFRSSAAVPDPAGLVYWCRHPPDVSCLAETGCGIRCYQATPRS